MDRAQASSPVRASRSSLARPERAVRSLESRRRMRVAQCRMESEPRPALLRCHGCGGSFEAIEGPTHRYMESSPGCWRAYGEVLAREYEERAYWPGHRLTTDTYAVQHPGRPQRVAIQSVALHLMSLHVVLELGASEERALRFLTTAVERAGTLRWLEPPAALGSLTIADVHAARGPRQHVELVHAWARSTWGAWQAHHDTIRGWASGMGARRAD